MRFIALLIVAFLCLAGANGHAAAQGTFKNVGGEEMGFISKGDPLMENAKRKARATLPDFLSLISAPRSTITGMQVKIGIPYGRNNHEFFWISELVLKDGKIIGRLNNTPRFVQNLREGQMLRFTQDDVVDWYYREDGTVKGNYTTCALITREPKGQQEALLKRYGLDCDF